MLSEALRRIAYRLLVLVVTVIAGGLICATLVRTGPGFNADERELDIRLDGQSRALIAAERAANNDILRFYWTYLVNGCRGDFGYSMSLKQPIAGLIGSRLPVTVELVILGWAGGWVWALMLALSCTLWPCATWSRLTGALSCCVLCIPAGAVTVVVFLVRTPASVAIAVVLWPKLFEYVRNLFRDALTRPHVLTARAKGVGSGAIAFRHVLPACAPELLAIAGISITMAFGIAIPVETLCDLPGIGQLAWHAAISRDLPLLITITIMITMLTQVCNIGADCAVAGLPWRRKR